MVEITRDELLERLADRGYPVKARALEYWQLQGHLPYPTRKGRAMFPESHVDAVIGFIEAHGNRYAKNKRKPQTKSMLQSRIAELERRVAELEGRADG